MVWKLHIVNVHLKTARRLFKCIIWKNKICFHFLCAFVFIIFFKKEQVLELKTTNETYEIYEQEQELKYPQNNVYLVFRNFYPIRGWSGILSVSDPKILKISDNYPIRNPLSRILIWSYRIADIRLSENFEINFCNCLTWKKQNFSNIDS